MEFEEAIKHYSDHYIGIYNCEVCNEIEKILSKYEFLLLKTWDYED